jgi:probable rRNA maturation factor
MPAEIVDETGREADLAAAAERAAGAILSCVAHDDSELSVLLVGDERMRELNARWRGKDRATDVLSFPQAQQQEEQGPAPVTMLGDVVVSVDTLRRQAGEGGWTAEEELVRLLLHGVLHLLGYDHETDRDARVMHAEEARIVGLLEERGIGCAWEKQA